MPRQFKHFAVLWLSIGIAYGIISSFLAFLFGIVGTWSFGMSGPTPFLYYSHFLFPSQIAWPLPESFPAGMFLLHAFVSGTIYSTVFIAAIYKYRSIEKFKNGA